MEQQDSSNTGSYDKKKNEDDEAEATLPPTDGTTVRNWVSSGWEEAIRRYLEESKAWRERNESESAPGLGGVAGWEFQYDNKQRYESPYVEESKAWRERNESESAPGLGGVAGWEFQYDNKQRYESPYVEGKTYRDKECVTCKWQCPRNEDFCTCHRKLTPIIDRHKFQLKSSPVKARPGSSSSLLPPDPARSNLSGGGTSTMHNHGSSGEVIGFAHEEGDIEMAGMHSPGHTVSASDSPPTVKSSRQLQLLNQSLDRDHGEPYRVLNVPCKDSDIDIGGTHSSDHVQGGPTLVLQGDSLSHGFANEHHDIEMGGTHSSDPVQGGPTLVLRGDSSSHGFAHEHDDIEMGGTHSSDPVQGGPTLVLQGDSSSHGFADEDSGIEMGGTHSSDGVPGEPRLVDLCSYHHAHEDTWQRLADMVDPLLSVNVQGACSLVAYKSSEGSSAPKDLLFYLVVFLYVLGFLSALGGKFYRCAKMGVIGLAAAALGFLMTMALVVVYKI